MLLPAVLLLSCAPFVLSQNITLTWPLITTPPQNASQILDPRLASFSIEFAYLTVFGGNATSPNLLTKALMERLVERTGVGPVSTRVVCGSRDSFNQVVTNQDVRPGGITMSTFQNNH